MLVIGALARFLSFSLFLLFFVVLLPCILVNKVVYISVCRSVGGVLRYLEPFKRGSRVW